MNLEDNSNVQAKIDEEDEDSDENDFHEGNCLLLSFVNFSPSI